MRRLNLVLLASLQLCQARQHSFSVHDDLLAYPQFEVVFADDFISEADALAILELSNTKDDTYTADFSRSDLTNVRKARPAEASGTTSGHGSGHDTVGDDDDTPIAETYELINSDPWHYLCAVPVLAPPPVLNQTATELAKAEEARELSRASAKGWELMSGLEGQCMYYVSGWWSYSFCYGKNVVQFHALPGTKPTDPPVRDGNNQEYVLGRVQHRAVSKKNAAGDSEAEEQTKSLTPPNAQLQVKGDQRYLSQRLEGGTICDLTGRPRTIEIQYHCSPGSTADRIGWVKEVTTCTYMMVVYTPRLCSDVAFLPPKESRAHPIRCRPIISTKEEELTWRYNKLVAAGELLGQKTGTAKPAAKDLPHNHFVGTTIGGIVVGSKKHVSDELAGKLPLPRGALRQAAPTVQVLASSKSGTTEVEIMSDTELEKLNLDPKLVKESVEKMRTEEGDKGWTLQYVKHGDKVEYYGVVYDDEIDVEQEGVRRQDLPWESNNQKGDEASKNTPKNQRQDASNGGETTQTDEEEEGSQEVFFKEEL
ncbi:glucosidase II beta subunit-like protein-domain-containing protein [Corynascus novoguineensis]|uniref:Endoplasmic reticulum lectin n=1 Tax=Corynascus novoguineensis TaxID=1126955 RepID=A0AAN7CP86_9PEZI|nr:glucosidase II beta subunit-like protein-domain-containing protein [Corynascus novoguineensis]